MKPFFVFLCFCYLFVLNVSAQKWLWVREGADSTTQDRCQPTATATDNAGNVLQAGAYSGKITFGSQLLYTPQLNTSNAYVVKYNSTGSVLWAKSSSIASTASKGFSYGIATDKAGNIYVTGVYQDTTTFGANTLIASGTTNVFLVKYDANGNIVWVKSPVLVGNESNCFGLSVAVSPSGSIYVTGHYNDTIIFGTYTLYNGYLGNTFLVKYNTNGNVLWAKNAKISTKFSQNQGNDVATDMNGNVYVTGQYVDSIGFDSYFLSALSFNAYLVKYDSSGSVLWVKAPVKLDNNVGNACNAYSDVTDAAGNIYVTGFVQDSVSFDKNVVYSPYIPGSNIFLVKYSPAGNVIWVRSATPVSKPFFAEGYALAVSKNTNIYLTGSYSEPMIFDGISFPNDSNGATYLIKFDSAGNALCSCWYNPYEGISYITNMLASDPAGDNVYISGAFSPRQWYKPNYTIIGDTALFVDYIAGYLGKWTCACTLSSSINSPDTICAGGSAGLYASGGLEYSWSPSSGLNSTTDSNPTATPPVSTTYTVTITNGNCTATDSTKVYVYPTPVITACCDINIQYGQSVQLTASGGGSYSWSPASGISCSTCSNPTVTPLQTTTYTVTVTSDSGCSSQYTVTIDVSCGQVFVPDAFSPNNDGQNDVLYVRGDCIKTLNFMVYDRWGNKVFETTDKNIGWDGTYKGEAINTGTYVYYLNAQMYDGTSIEKKGSISLIR